MDEVQVRAINNANGKNLPETPTLLFEFIGTGELDSVIDFCLLGLIVEFLLLLLLIVACCDLYFHSYLLFLEAYSREQTQIVQKIVSEHNGSDFVFAEDPEAKKELWKVRNFDLYNDYRLLPVFIRLCYYFPSFVPLCLIEFVLNNLLKHNPEITFERIRIQKPSIVFYLAGI